ncbi:MAG: hypothetical protein V2I57_16375 [Xanthomonadales bacterium]|jgi:hypothetical protein|nr:hypothetical protein [Xanthomonadales bacterium]
MHLRGLGRRWATTCTRVFAVLALSILATLQVTAQAPDRPLAEPVDGHRALRDNVPAAPSPPSAPETFEGFPDAPAFSVVAREKQLTWHPCKNCHIALPPNPEPRQLMAPHAANLAHGDGRFWCLQCHDLEDRNQLRTLDGRTVGFDDAWKVCGQCHFQPQKDWAFGAHGKRVDTGPEERVIYNCTHCHDPHDPSIKPRAPEPAPAVREGLAPMILPDEAHEH